MIQPIPSSIRYGLILGSALLCGNACASIADLYISEVMANPAAVSDTLGEWFELYNPTPGAVDLNGILLSDDGSNSHVMHSDGALLINPGAYFVLGRSGDISSNGGYHADYVYGNFSLNNGSDQIVLSDSLGHTLRLDFSSGFVAAGTSSELTGLPMTADNYALSDSQYHYGLGDVGTPGSAGSYTPPSPVPLPAALWLFASGLLGLVGVAQTRREA